MNSILTEYDEEQVLADIGQERYEEGKAEGIAEGKMEGIAESVLELLGEYCEVPEDLKNTIQSEADIDTLSRWLKLAARSDSIESFKALMYVH